MPAAYVCRVREVTYPPGTTAEAIEEARQKFLAGILACQGNWPNRPRTRRLIELMSKLEVGDEKTGRWRISKEEMDHPASCPTCHKRPQFGFYLLQETRGGSELQMCGRCLTDLATPQDASTLRRYWNNVGGPLHAVSDWRDLMVGIRVWLELHKTYQHIAGSAREQWAYLKRAQEWYDKRGYLHPVVADNAALIVSDVQWDMVAHDKVELKRSASAVMWTPEQRMLSELLKPSLFRHLGGRHRQRLIDLWRQNRGLARPVFKYKTRIWLNQLYSRALREKRWETIYGDRDS